MPSPTAVFIAQEPYPTKMIDPFSELLQQQSVVILDGGFATELEHQGVDLSQVIRSPVS